MVNSRWLNTDEAHSAADPALASKVKQAYSDVTVSGSQLTFSTVGGDSKSVSVTGGAGASVTAFNGATLNTSTNEVTFSSTTGASADEVVLDLDPMLTPLETLTSGHTTNITTNTNDISDIENLNGSSTLVTTVDGHTTDINDFKSREQFKNVTQHPDLENSQMGTFNPTVNGRSYVFSHSSSHSASYIHRHAFRSGSEKWLTSTNGNHTFDTLVSGSYYDYSGTVSLDGNSGEWLQVQLPEAVIMNSFTISAAASESIPRSFVIIASNDGTNYDLVGQYTDVDVATTDTGSHFKLDSSLSSYGTAYDRYALVVTRAQRYGSKSNVGVRHLRYFSVSKDVSDTIATANDMFTYKWNSIRSSYQRVASCSSSALSLRVTTNP